VLRGRSPVLPGSPRFSPVLPPVLPGSPRFSPVLPGSPRFCPVTLAIGSSRVFVAGVLRHFPRLRLHSWVSLCFLVRLACARVFPCCFVVLVRFLLRPLPDKGFGRSCPSRFLCDPPRPVRVAELHKVSLFDPIRLCQY
jgi:hypothetical protein